MKIILLEKIKNLGNLGEVVEVKPGYARNFLLPSGKAQSATEKNIKSVEARKAELAEKANDQLVKAQIIADKVNGSTITIFKKESGEGKIFGSVANTDILEALSTEGHEIDKRQIQLDASIRALGEYKVRLLLHTDLTAEINVVVSAEKEV